MDRPYCRIPDENILSDVFGSRPFVYILFFLTLDLTGFLIKLENIQLVKYPGVTNTYHAAFQREIGNRCVFCLPADGRNGVKVIEVTDKNNPAVGREISLIIVTVYVNYNCNVSHHQAAIGAIIIPGVSLPHCTSVL